ncbi:hypothetical protein GGR57DRAFT_504511 [Xylariaceae sp. FL1272]|nr:hypothetical protein GGR57DRAFT_504511 [Xylariaceae sp. FL1272]
MPVFNVVPGTFENLRGQVVVLTGGANGVGECCVETPFSVGAHIIFGDIDEEGGVELISTLKNAHTFSKGSIHFVKVDVRSYEGSLALYKLAFDKHRRVDHALSNAGVTEYQISVTRN